VSMDARKILEPSLIRRIISTSTSEKLRIVLEKTGYFYVTLIDLRELQNVAGSTQGQESGGHLRASLRDSIHSVCDALHIICSSVQRLSIFGLDLQAQSLDRTLTTDVLSKAELIGNYYLIRNVERFRKNYSSFWLRDVDFHCYLAAHTNIYASSSEPLLKTTYDPSLVKIPREYSSAAKYCKDTASITGSLCILLEPMLLGAFIFVPQKELLQTFEIAFESCRWGSRFFSLAMSEIKSMAELHRLRSLTNDLTFQRIIDSREKTLRFFRK